MSDNKTLGVVVLIAVLAIPLTLVAWLARDVMPTVVIILAVSVAILVVCGGAALIIRAWKKQDATGETRTIYSGDVPRNLTIHSGRPGVNGYLDAPPVQILPPVDMRQRLGSGMRQLDMSSELPTFDDEWGRGRRE